MEKASLKDKHVLFIGHVFYDYHQKIIEQFEKIGVKVTFFENRYFGDDNVSSLDILGTVRKWTKPRLLKKYNDSILEGIKNKRFDYLFCIGGFSITDYLVSNIKTMNPGIKSIIYFWDSFTTWNFSSLLPLFDRSFTFDPKDSEKYDALGYLQLFYTSEYSNFSIKVKQDIDILYVGSVSILSENRLSILSAIKQKSDLMGLKTYIWLYDSDSARSFMGKCQSLFRNLFMKRYKDYLTKIKLSKKNGLILRDSVLKREEISKLFQRAKVIVDIPLKKQYGLTIRSIEALSAGKKLLTSNPYIMKEAFYDANSIKILYENEVDLKDDFLKQNNPYVNIEHLHLGNWIHVALLT